MKYQLTLPPKEQLAEHDFVFVLPIESHFREAMAENLNPEERERAGKFKCESARRQFILAHWLKGTILSFYTGIPTYQLTYSKNAHGKPRLINTPNELYFNISHTEGHVALMLSCHHEVGIDIEIPREQTKTEALIDFTFHPNEIATLKMKGISTATFYRYWTLKEAASKALGLGLFLPFNTMLILKRSNQYYQYTDANKGKWALAYIALPLGVHLSFCFSETGTTSVILTCFEQQETRTFNHHLTAN